MLRLWHQKLPELSLHPGTPAFCIQPRPSRSRQSGQWGGLRATTLTHLTIAARAAPKQRPCLSNAATTLPRATDFPTTDVQNLLHHACGAIRLRGDTGVTLILRLRAKVPNSREDDTRLPTASDVTTTAAATLALRSAARLNWPDTADKDCFLCNTGCLGDPPPALDTRPPRPDVTATISWAPKDASDSVCPNPNDESSMCTLHPCSAKSRHGEVCEP